jgi:hypothetical protein
MIKSRDLLAKEERKPLRKRLHHLHPRKNPRRKELRVKIKQEKPLRAIPRQLEKRKISD